MTISFLGFSFSFSFLCWTDRGKVYERNEECRRMNGGGRREKWRRLYENENLNAKKENFKIVLSFFFSFHFVCQSIHVCSTMLPLPFFMPPFYQYFFSIYNTKMKTKV